MTRRRVAQVVAAVTAAIGLVLSVVYGGNESASTALKVYSYGTSVSLLLLLGYEHVAWHWAWVRVLTKQPDLRGTWLGELTSSYEREGQQVAAIPSILRITQTAWSQQVTLFSGESSSVTEQSQLVREPDGRWRLTWTYANTPRTSVRHRSAYHLGTAEVICDATAGLRGSYYTDRLTRGEIAMARRSPKLYSSVAAAQAEEATFQ